MSEDPLADQIKQLRDDYTWAVEFEDREIAEILFALQYVDHYKHGTSGHLGYIVISKLFEALNIR